MLEFLHKHGANLEARDECGYTPLIIAAQCADRLMVDFLIKRGANVNAADLDGIPPICQTASEDVAQLLIEAGAELEGQVGKTGYTIEEYITRECGDHHPEIPALVSLHLAKREKTRLEACLGAPEGKPVRKQKL